MNRSVIWNAFSYCFRLVWAGFLVWLIFSMLFILVGAAGMREVKSSSDIDELEQSRSSIIVDTGEVPAKIQEIRKIYNLEGCTVRFTGAPKEKQFGKTELFSTSSCGSRGRAGKTKGGKK